MSRGKTNHPLHNAFIEAGQQAGYPFTDDMNGYQQEGLGWMDMTIHKGEKRHFQYTEHCFSICKSWYYLCREEVEHSQRLPEARAGPTQPEDRGALPGQQDSV